MILTAIFKFSRRDMLQNFEILSRDYRLAGTLIDMTSTKSNVGRPSISHKPPKNSCK
jgi:hypothetical protein